MFFAELYCFAVPKFLALLENLGRSMKLLYDNTGNFLHQSFANSFGFLQIFDHFGMFENKNRLLTFIHCRTGYFRLEFLCRNNNLAFYFHVVFQITSLFAVLVNCYTFVY